MNRELKRMLQLAGGLLACALVIINLGALFHRAPASLHATTTSWRIHANRLRRMSKTHPSERGPYPLLTKAPVSLVALKHDQRIYLMQSGRVVYIFNATIRRPANSRVTLGAQRGRKLYQFQGKQTITNGSWLSAGPDDYLAALVSQVPKGSIRVSAPDATWLVQHLPANTPLVIK